jgi:hypothetical protein
MKKVFTIAAFIVIAGITTIILTSGSNDRYGGGKDMVEELYGQAVKQNDALETIENDIDKFYKKRQEAVEKYNAYHSYHTRYYQDARSNAATIADAATKQRANDLITQSEARYNGKIANWQSTIATLNASERELNSLHSFLKIMISEAMIDKVQTSELPDNARAKEVNGDLQKIIAKIKAITK